MGQTVPVATRSARHVSHTGAVTLWWVWRWLYPLPHFVQVRMRDVADVLGLHDGLQNFCLLVSLAT
jgi:hypothetical protein